MKHLFLALTIAAIMCPALASASTVTVNGPAVVDCGLHREAIVRNDAGRERVTCVTAARSRVVTHRVVRHRSALKSAAVIGGSAAAGAGIGALAGGGKGALIGAAAGGGAGTIYEVHKRQQANR
jgi:hypothetical protein